MLSTQCLECKHYQGSEVDDFGLVCDAFHGGIPEEILLNKFDHRKLYPGDHGIQFEPIEGGE